MQPVVNRPFELLTEIYYDENGNSKEIRQEDIQNFELALDTFELLGTSCMATGFIGLGATYVVPNVPYVGSLAKGIIGAASIASIIFGYDIHKVFNNVKDIPLENFWKPEEESVILNTPLEVNKEISKKEIFKRELEEKAFKGTYCIKRFVKF